MAAVSWHVDCRHLPAPYPLLGARTAIALMNDGEILSLLLTDRDCALDAPAWCRMTGNRFVGAREHHGIHCLLIQKGVAPCPSH